MSIEARQKLVADLVIRDASAKADLLDPSATHTELVALLIDAVAAAKALGLFVLVTAVRSDHHDDSALGRHSHANGFAADTWLLNSPADGDWAQDWALSEWLRGVAKSPWLYQVGLAGEADTDENRAIVRAVGFEDSGADHVHLGAIG